MASPKLPADADLDLWNQANDVLYVHDLAGRFQAVNAAALQVYGYTEAELLAMDITALVDPSHLPIATANLRAKAANQVQASAPYELLTRTKNGQPVWVEVSTRSLLRDGRPYAIHGAARVITVRKQAEAIADLLHETALALSSARRLEDGIGDAITRIATAAGWTYAEAWFPDAEGTLRLGPQWVGAPGLEKFSRLAKQYRFIRGEGLPGRAWEKRVALWAAFDAPIEDFPRSAAAVAAGLRSYATIPVLHEGELVAALVFLGPAPLAGQERWVQAADKVAAHLAASIHRGVVMDRIRSAARMFAAQFEAVDDAMLMLDAEGRPRQANAAFLRLCGVQRRDADAAVPLLDRLDDPERFLAAVASLYEDRSEGLAIVRAGEQRLNRHVLPLIARSGERVGTLLQLRR